VLRARRRRLVGRLPRAAASGRHNWLGVLDESNAFVFLIKDVRVRLYRS
jgi:hypothetical protein